MKGLKLLQKCKRYNTPNLNSPLRNQIQTAQCGNFKIFVSFRFYVKSILRIIEVQNQPFYHISEDLNFDFYEFLHFRKAEIDQTSKFRALKIAKKGSFRISRFSKFDFT